MSSFIIRDTLGPAVGTSNQRLALWRRFKKGWPNNGVLYDERLVYYDGKLLDTVAFRRLCNIMGIKYSNLEDQDYDEIEECWFYLKPPTLKGAFFSAAQMYSAMESNAILENEVCTVKFSYCGKLGRSLPNDRYVVINTVNDGVNVVYNEQKAMDAGAIQATIMSDPAKYVLSQMPRASAAAIDQYMYSEEEEYYRSEKMRVMSDEYKKQSEALLYEEPLVQIFTDSKYGWYPIFDDSYFTFNQTTMTTPERLPASEGYGYQWTVTYTAIKDIEPTDPCMLAYEAFFNERIYLQKMNGSLPHRTTEADFRLINEVDDIHMWPNGQLSVVRSDAMKRVDFVDMLGTSIDSDYKIEDPSFWEKVFAVVVVIVAIVVTIFSMGSLAGLAWYAAAAVIGFAFAMGAIALAVGSAILGYYGGPSANGLVKIIGNCAQYMGLISSILGIMSFIGNFVRKIGSEAIKKAGEEAAKKAAKNAATSAAGKVAYEQVMTEAIELASSSFIERAATVSLEAISSAISFSGQSIVDVGTKLTSWADNLFAVYKYYDQNFGEVAALNTEIEENREKAQDLADLNEENSSGKLLINGMDIYTYSLGSYDAISELNVKMDKQSGGWTTDQDPCASIT